MPVRTSQNTRLQEVQLLTDNAFQVLELRPHLGNFFGESQDNAAILSYDYWQQEFHAAPEVIGQSLFVDGHPVVIALQAFSAFSGQAHAYDDRRAGGFDVMIVTLVINLQS